MTPKQKSNYDWKNKRGCPGWWLDENGWDVQRLITGTIHHNSSLHSQMKQRDSKPVGIHFSVSCKDTLSLHVLVEFVLFSIIFIFHRDNRVPVHGFLGWTLSHPQVRQWLVNEQWVTSARVTKYVWCNYT